MGANLRAELLDLSQPFAEVSARCDFFVEVDKVIFKELMEGLREGNFSVEALSKLEEELLELEEGESFGVFSGLVVEDIEFGGREFLGSWDKGY